MCVYAGVYAGVYACVCVRVCVYVCVYERVCDVFALVCNTDAAVDNDFDRHPTVLVIGSLFAVVLVLSLWHSFFYAYPGKNAWLQVPICTYFII